ncbi:MAG: peptidoglycan DD-metalloendopeptidase family protein [Lachnospiraceae bacterium]
MKSMKKERIIMLASSVFVLTALTMTGFYVREKNKEEKDGYMVDISGLEKQTEQKTDQIAAAIEDAKKDTFKQEGTAMKDSDLDYDPGFQETSSASVTNTWDTVPDSAEKRQDSEETVGEHVSQENIKPVEEEKETEAEDTAAAQASSASVQNALSFQERDNLLWPVAGNVLINYSMDKTVYFPTLEQYKYNPAIVIAATEGENIVAAADGKVVSVFDDAQIGHAVKVDIGSGYELTYGGLQDIMVMKGDVVRSGDVLGKVSTPTKYYTVEGPNVYFAMTKNGVPVNPLERME